MPLSTWPVNILDEFQTVQKLQDGYSVSRFGDGEIALADGGAQVREPVNPALAAELRQIISVPQPGLLVGIPTLDRHGPKYANWVRRAPRFLKFLAPDMPYVSAFLTRPDSAPAIQTWEFAENLQACWANKKAVVVSEPDSKLLVAVTAAARKTVHVCCPHRETYAVLGDIEREVLRNRPEIVLLSHGPSATCLAARLCRLGIQALDLGSIGAMLLRLLPIERVTHVYPFALRHPELQGNRFAMVVRLEAAGFEVLYAGEREGTDRC